MLSEGENDLHESNDTAWKNVQIFNITEFD